MNEQSLTLTDAFSDKHPQNRWWQLIVVVGVLALLAVVGFKLHQVTLGPVSSGRAPDFTLSTFNGQKITPADLQAKIVVLNFWASWCGPCKEEAADLEATWREYQDQGVLFLGIDYVDTEDRGAPIHRRI